MRASGGGQRGDGVEIDFAWGDRCRIWGADEVLLSCTVETCLVL